MKKLFIYLFLIFFSFHSPSYSNDLKEFVIEDMSIGDSLLNHISKEEIKKFNIDSNNNNVFKRIQLLSKDFSLLKTYDGMHIYIDPNDKEFLIHGIEGMLIFKNDISNCLFKKDEILNDISGMFKNNKQKSKNENHSQDKSGKSKTFRNFIKINQSSKYYELELGCYDWSEEMKFFDHFRISIITDKVNDTIN
tara:strand:+ start:398 stop:976 length:579 start_codon:yes stop_codon:yes gene_type:complete